MSFLISYAQLMPHRVVSPGVIGHAALARFSTFAQLITTALHETDPKKLAWK